MMRNSEKTSAYHWNITHKDKIHKSKQEVWSIISGESNLELFHPFCNKNKVISWSQESSVDQIEYLNGSLFRREFSKWCIEEGYNLYINQLGKPSSYVEWRLKGVGSDCEVKISIYPYLCNTGNRLIYFAPFNLFVRPLLKSYLYSVIGGLKLYAEKNIQVKNNHFGKHIWFS